MLNDTKIKFLGAFTKSNPIFIIVVFGVVYRILMHFWISDKVLLVGDSDSYIFLAEKIKNFDFSGYNGERTPGYPLLIFLAFGSLQLTVVYQHLLGVISSVFIYKTFLNFNLTPKISLFIILFSQCFFNVYFYETAILTETLCLFLMVFVFYMFSNNFLENTSCKTDWVFGLLLGFLTLVKPFYAFLPFVFYFFIVLKRKQISALVNKRMIILFFPLLVYFGWSYVNKWNTGYFSSTTYFGLNLAQNCVYFAEKTPEKYQWIGIPYAKHREQLISNGESNPSMAIWSAYNDGEFDYKKKPFADLSNSFGEYAIQTIKNNPKDYFNQVITRSWFDFWRPTIPYYEDKIEPEKKVVIEKLWFVQRKLFNFIKFGFLLLIPFYLIQFLKNKVVTTELVVIVLVFLTSILQGLITYGTNPRYSFPFEYIMIAVIALFVKNNFFPLKK